MVEERPINVGKTLDTQNINIHVGGNENKIGGYQMVDMSDFKSMVDFFPKPFIIIIITSSNRKDIDCHLSYLILSRETQS